MNDSEIQQAVLRELKWDLRVKETDVGVEVDKGVVTLTGTVASWAERKAAAEAAHRVERVRDVANDIQVKIPGTGKPTDTDIAAAVRHALEWAVFVPDKKIRSTVSDGVVTLEGVVDRYAQREDAERCIEQLAGVRLIVNSITVLPPKVAESSVRNAITDALSRQASTEAKAIEVSVQDGRVIVSGPVHSYQEQQTVLNAARGTQGVREVTSQLHFV